jgi:MFS family permease
MSEVEQGPILKNKNLMILAIALGVILNPLNTTMITVALPEIKGEFSLSSNDISWLIASYFMISAIFLPLIGKLSDHYGRKRIFISGLVLVAISSFTAPLSPNMPFLLGMRAIQAIGTSALYPAGIGLVRSFIEKNQNRVIATLSVSATTSAAFGPTISGLLIQYGGWPIIFYVNFPIIILSAFLAILYFPADGEHKSESFKWDKIGIMLFSLTMLFWMYFLLSLENGISLFALGVSVLVTISFYQYEKKRMDPFINVTFLKKNLNITLVYVQYILSTVIFFTLLLSMPIYLQNVMMVSSERTGLMMLSISIFSVMGTPIATRWMEKSGYRFPMLTGVMLGIIGAVLLITIDPSSSLYWIFFVLSIIGLSNGIQNIGLQTRLYSLVPITESGIASGLFMTSRFIGNIFASSLFGLMFTSGITDGNQHLLSIILVFVSLILLPGMIYVTKQRASGL